MPRRQRLVLPGVPLHIVQRGHDRKACFLHDDDYLLYLDWLHQHALANHCQIHAYVLMSNHVHLLLSAPHAEALARMMKALSQNYSQHFNRRHQHLGSTWQGRYKSSCVQTEEYFLACQRYIELNPVRAGLVNYPGNYRWSSYRAHAEGRPDRMLTPHSLYRRLGNTPAVRRLAYQGLFEEPLAAIELARIREALNAERSL